MEIVRRGYSANDSKEFNKESVKKLMEAGSDLYYLINRGYNIKGASQFVANHFLLSERQRLAITRGISPKNKIELREQKRVDVLNSGSVINIDGFNTIITLEVAYSESVLIKGMDGTMRDLASLRGTYRLIDKTDMAIEHIGEWLENNRVEEVVFYLDEQVSNSIRLKNQIISLLGNRQFKVNVELSKKVDSILEQKENVVTSDAIILDKCASWINMNAEIIKKIQSEYIDFSSIGFSDFDEITEEEAEAIVKKRKAGALNA